MSDLPTSRPQRHAHATSRLGGAATLPDGPAHGPGPSPVAGAGPELQPTARRRRWVIALVSAATAIWLAAQLATGLAMTVQTWPVAGFPMFSETRSAVGERLIQARMRSGRVVTVRPGDFGLTELQFLNYQRGIVSDAGMVKPQARARLARLAAIWNRRHRDDPAVSMTATHLVHPLPYGTPARSRQVITWSAP